MLKVFILVTMILDAIVGGYIAGWWIAHVATGNEERFDYLAKMPIICGVKELLKLIAKDIRGFFKVRSFENEDKA